MVMHACNSRIQKTVIVREAWDLKTKKEVKNRIQKGRTDERNRVRREGKKKKGRKGDRETDLQENLIATLNTLNYKDSVLEKGICHENLKPCKGRRRI